MLLYQMGGVQFSLLPGCGDGKRHVRLCCRHVKRRNNCFKITNMDLMSDDRGGDADADRKFLDQVLNSLYDFGDGVKNRKCQKRKSVCDEDAASDITDPRLTESNPEECERGGVEVVTFVDPLKKKKKMKNKAPEVEEQVSEASSVSLQTGKDQTLTIEKARLDVHRLGLSGYQKPQQRVFEQDRAVMLGARPPKKTHVNYKVYQQMLKEKKLKEKEEATSGSQKSKRRGRSRSEKSRDPGGQVGRFRHGVLLLSSRDLQNLRVKK